MRRIPVVEAVPFIMKMFSGRIEKSRFATLMQARHFVAEVSEAQPLHLDGEPIPPSTRFDVQIQPGSLNVIIPR